MRYIYSWVGVVIYLFNNLQEPRLLKDEKSAWEDGQKRAPTPPYGRSRAMDGILYVRVATTDFQDGRGENGERDTRPMS